MASAVHREDARRFLIGVAATTILAIAVVIGIRPLLGGELLGSSYTYVRAAYTDVVTLQTRNDVRQNSVHIGQVSDVEYVNGQAVVTMRLDGHHAIYANARAQIRDESPLAKQFIDLDPGTPSAGPLAGQVIPANRDDNAHSLDVVLNVFDPQTRAALSTTMRNLGVGLAGHGPDLHDAMAVAPRLLTDIGTVTSSLAAPDAQLVPLLHNADRLVGRFQNRQTQIRGLLQQLDTTVDAVDTDDARPLTETLRQLPSTLRDAHTALDSLDDPLTNLHATVQTARPGIDALGVATPDVRGILREGVSPLNKLPHVAHDASPAIKNLTHTLADARRLAPQLGTAIDNLQVLGHGLGPYAQNIGSFFAQEDLLGGELSPDKHYFSAQVPFFGPYNASLPDPTVTRDPYPVPKQAPPGAAAVSTGDGPHGVARGKR